MSFFKSNTAGMSAIASAIVGIASTNPSFTSQATTTTTKKEAQQLTSIEEMTSLFVQQRRPTVLLPAIVQYLQEAKEDVNGFNAMKTFNALNNKHIISMVTTLKKAEVKYEAELESFKEAFAKEGFKALDISIAFLYFKLKMAPAKRMKDVLKQVTNSEPENMIAIEKLVQELETSYIKLVTLDVAFFTKLLETRPLVIAVMLSKPQLRHVLLHQYKSELQHYIQNEDVYKQMLPFVHIMDGKTHGQWRHVASPEKTCVVLYTKNCTITSPKNTKKSYSSKETEGQFITLAGLSFKAHTDDAEVHYVEV